MDAVRKRVLKQLGKAEVARRSEELHAALSVANPAPIGSSQWIENHALGSLRERWLSRSLPLLHAKHLHSLFVVRPVSGHGWVPHLGGYVICTTCGSAAPSAIPWRIAYWKSCACGNIGWRSVLGWTRSVVRNPYAVVPVSLTGRGETG